MQRNFVCALSLLFVLQAYSQQQIVAEHPETPALPTDSTLLHVAVIIPNHPSFYTQKPGLDFLQAKRAADNANKVYKLNPWVDIPVTAAGIAWSTYGFKEIYSKPSSSVQSIQGLRSSDINGFDRWATKYYNEKANDLSDKIFYGSIPVPLLLLADHDIRSDGFKVTFLYLETMSVMGIFYTGTAYLVDRYRPLAYNSEVHMDERTDGNSRNSFLGGHPALVATTTFFAAKVFSDYHPDSKLRWVFFGGAAAATGYTAYLRLRAGKHFPSDLLTGMTVGTLTGILVPHFHKNRARNERLSLVPMMGRSTGFHLTYKL